MDRTVYNSGTVYLFVGEQTYYNGRLRPVPDGTVIRSGLFFRIGDYPDLRFALNETEADAAIATFKPCPINVEHIPTIFDGKMGWVWRIWREDDAIMAEYALPRWLLDVMQNEPIKISSEWNRGSKQPTGCAFALNPRVTGTAIEQAEYSQVMFAS